MSKKTLLATMTTIGICVASLLQQIPVFAAGSVNVSADKTTANVSDTVTVTVQTSDPEDAATAPQISVTYDTEMLNFESCNVEYGGGGGGLITVTGTSAQIKFSTLKEGTASVNAEAIIDEDGNNPATGSTTLTIGGGEAPAEGGTTGGSSDAALKALVVSPGTMVPEFSPEVTDYKIYVAEDVTDVKISGGVRDDNATITGASGFKNLELGSNLAVITVSAEDGTVLTYNFTIERGGEAPEVVDTPAAPAEESVQEEASDEEQTESVAEEKSSKTEAGSMQIEMNDKTYQIQASFDDSVLPEGSVKSKLDYYGTLIDCANIESAGIDMVYAISDADGAGQFFVYDEGNESFSIFLQIRGANGHYIIPIEAKGKVPSGFKETGLAWNQTKIQAYRLSKQSVNHADVLYLLYAINQDGVEDFYLYDVEEFTYQRFLNYSGKVSTGSAGGSMVLTGCLLIVIVGLVLLVVMLVMKNRELNGDLEILAQARERRRSGESAPKKQAAPKQVVMPDQAQEPSQAMDVANPKKKAVKKVEPVQRTVEPDVATEIPPMAQLAKGNEEPAPVKAKKQEKREKVVVPVTPANVPEEDTKEEIDVTVSENVGSGNLDDLADVADLLNNEENMEFTKMLASFSTGRVNVVRPQAKPQVKAAQPAQMAKPVAPVEIEPTLDIIGEEESGEDENVIPVVNVERKSVSLTREALPDEPDDDFEFEFINLDEN